MGRYLEIATRALQGTDSAKKANYAKKAHPDEAGTHLNSLNSLNSQSVDSLNDAEDLDADAREYLDERAAIAEYDGGLPREQAERQHIRPVFEFQLAERPGVWFTLLCQQGDTLDDARHWCEQRFGPDRLVGVRDRVLGGRS